MHRMIGANSWRPRPTVRRPSRSQPLPGDPGESRDNASSTKTFQPSPGSTPLARRRYIGGSSTKRHVIKKTDLPDDSFPASGSFVDCCGKLRVFDLELLETGSGYFVRATEHVSGNDGYAFAAHAESDPWLALGRLRQTIQSGLATRYLVEEDHHPSLGHDVAVGHIAFGGVVVDGRYLSYDEFAVMLSAYEGWRFRISIVDAYGTI